MTPKLVVGTIELPVPSLEEAVVWYTKALGCEVEWSDQGHALLAWPEQDVRLLLVVTPDPLRLAFRNASGTILHGVVDFRTSDLERLHQHLTTVGTPVEPLGPPANDWAPPGFSFFDPAGNRFGAFSYAGRGSVP